MTYKEFRNALTEMEAKYRRNVERINESIKDWEERWERKEVDEKTATAEIDKLYDEFEYLKNRNARKVEQLKMNFAKQDAPAEIGDIIWATVKGSTKVMKVTEIRLAAFTYPMLKYFGVQLTMRGVPAKVQKVAPQGGIYQKDVHSVNGEPYEYKARE